MKSLIPTREKLLMASTDLFFQKGYYGTSIQDIAEACTIKKPSVFHHFISKTDIAMTVILFGKDHSKKHIFDLIGQSRGMLLHDQKQSIETALTKQLTQEKIYTVVDLLSRELATTDGFNHSILSYYSAWKKFIKSLLLRTHPRKSISEDLIIAWLNQMNGALGMYQGTKEKVYLDNFLQQVSVWLNYS